MAGVLLDREPDPQGAQPPSEWHPYAKAHPAVADTRWRGGTRLQLCCLLPAPIDRLPPLCGLLAVQEGSWDDVSGENFLRKLLSMPVEETRWDFYGAARWADCQPLP